MCQNPGQWAKHGPPSYFMWPKRASKMHDFLHTDPTTYPEAYPVHSQSCMENAAYPLTPNHVLSAVGAAYADCSIDPRQG